MYINPTGKTASEAIITVADFVQSQSLSKRQLGYGGYGYNNGYRYSGWSGYGRWILLGVVVGAIVLLWAVFCFCNRSRTRSGRKPVPYTGWMTPGQTQPETSGVHQGNYNNNTYANPAPMQQQYQQPYQPQQGYGQQDFNQPSYNQPAYNAPVGTMPPTYDVNNGVQGAGRVK